MCANSQLDNCADIGDWELAQTSRVVITAGAIVGLAAGAIASALASLAPWAFTSDAALYPVMRGVAPQVFASMVLCGIDVRCAICIPRIIAP